MMTLLPYPSYEESVKTFTPDLAVKQVADCVFILDQLHEQPNATYGWRNHPGTKMWEGHEVQLAEFGLVIVEYPFVQYPFDGPDFTEATAALHRHLDWAASGEFKLTKPEWFGDAVLHLSMQSVMIRHDPDHFMQIFPDTPNNMPFFWPR